LQRDGRAVLAKIENAGRAYRAVDGGENSQADLVDEAGAQKGPVRDATIVDL
jgi:hypothetical protein